MHTIVDDDGSCRGVFGTVPVGWCAVAVPVCHLFPFFSLPQNEFSVEYVEYELNSETVSNPVHRLHSLHR
jgi:hypothetical protein